MLPIEENRTRFIDELSAVDEKRDVSKLVAWLEKSDFFEAPASTRHHLDVKGGLCEHSLNVYARMLSLNECMGLELGLDSIAICALCHDICKAYFYGTEQRNRKNDKGKWEKYDAYMIDDKFPIGHGEKSVIILQKYIDLSAAEALAIRWHMGAWSCTEMEKRTLGDACRKFPLVFALQMADQCAAFWDEKQ
jgi:hypothetical protein